MTAQAAHAPLPPSAAERWGDQCPASATLEAIYSDFGQAEHEEAREWGNAAHDLVKRFFTQGVDSPLLGPDIVGSKASNGVIITDEMIDAADMVIHNVNETLGYLGIPLTGLHVEEQVQCDIIHPDNWGTPDLWAFAPRGDGGLLLLWDEKYGHKFVDAFLNWQCIDYTAGILHRPEFSGLNHRNVSVIITIIQPRNYHQSGPVRRWDTTATELAGYWRDLREAANEARGSNPRTRVGPACGDCKARAVCDALHKAGGYVADIAGTAIPVELPPDALGLELRNLHRAKEILDARIDGLETQALELIRSGKLVPYFTGSRTPGKEVWADEATVVAMDAALGWGITKPKPLTPNQTRNLKRNGAPVVPAETVAALATRNPGPLKLVPVDGKDAARVFQKPQGA